MMANKYYLNEQHYSWPSEIKITAGRNYLIYSQFLFSVQTRYFTLLFNSEEGSLTISFTSSLFLLDI